MLVKGPFEIKYGLDVLAGIEEIDFEYTVNTEDFDTIQGRSYEVVTSHRVAVSVTFLESDIPALADILPQYFVANGQALSTGETVNHADGAIDVVPGDCDYVPTTTDLVITSCGNPGHVLRVPDCETEIEDIDIDTVRKVIVRFKGLSDAATVQMFREGAVSIVS